MSFSLRENEENLNTIQPPFLCFSHLHTIYLTIIVAHHMYDMPPYPYLATDYGTQLSLFTHHMWIWGFLIVGAAAHATIFMVRDYDPTTWPWKNTSFRVYFSY